MKWQKIDNYTNKSLLLLINDKNDIIVGYAHYQHIVGRWDGYSDESDVYLRNVTHFIPVADLLKLEKE